MYWLWNPDPVAFTLGNIGVSWYGLLWAAGFLIAQRVVIFIYAREGRPGRDLDALLIYLIVGTVVGARIGHCLFYDPLYYLQNPLAIVRVWEGGLASHGAAAGILVALYLFSRRTMDQPFLWLVDRIAIVAAIVGGLVRVGNFINSEIIGTPTHSSYGVVFTAPMLDAALHSDSSITAAEIRPATTQPHTHPGVLPLALHIRTSHVPVSVEQRNGILQRVHSALFTNPASKVHLLEHGWESSPSWRDGATDATVTVGGLARHPVQLYEAAVSLALGAVLFAVWWRRKIGIPHGSMLGWFLFVTFSSRFLLERLKEPVTAFDAGWPLSIGQFLSIPCILAGVLLLVTRKAIPEGSSSPTRNQT